MKEFGGGLFDVIGNNTSNAHEKAAGLLQQRRVEMLKLWMYNIAF
jgi:hypothetical protein